MTRILYLALALMLSGLSWADLWAEWVLGIQPEGEP